MYEHNLINNFQRTVEEAREHCSVTLSEGGKKPNTKCVWPFKFNKKMYDGVCSNVGVSTFSIVSKSSSTQPK